MKTSKLIVQHDYDFELYAIISSVKTYKLAWELNQVLNIVLSKKQDVLFEFLKEKSKLYFINYKFETEYSCFRFIKNKACEFYNTSKPYLIPELKEYDYLLLLANSSVFDEKKILEQLKKISNIEYINLVEINTLKSKENLIF